MTKREPHPASSTVRRLTELKLRSADELPRTRRRIFWALVDAEDEVTTHELLRFCGPKAGRSNVKVHICLIRRWLRNSGLPHAVQYIAGKGYRLI